MRANIGCSQKSNVAQRKLVRINTASGKVIGIRRTTILGTVLVFNAFVAGAGFVLSTGPKRSSMFAVDLLPSMTTLPLIVLGGLMAAGIAALTFGGSLLCRGSVGVALFFNIRPVVVGLTVVALATSTPELFTSLVAAWSGNTDLVLGNIVGSNIANVGLILAISALICPLVIKHRLIRRDVPLAIAATILFCLLARDSLGRWDGVALLLLFGAYFVWVLRKPARAMDDDEVDLSVSGEKGWRWNVVCILAGTVLLAAGAEVLVASAVETAGRLGVGEVLIGITLVAVGTSLPELSAALSAALMRQADLCAGNIVGSSLFNLLLVAGASAAVHPIPVDDLFYVVEMPALIVFTVLLWPFFLTGRIVSRREGAVLLIMYGGFLLLTCLVRTGWVLGS